MHHTMACNVFAFIRPTYSKHHGLIITFYALVLSKGRTFVTEGIKAQQFPRHEQTTSSTSPLLKIVSETQAYQVRSS